MKIVNRNIATAYIVSADNMLLLGKKRPGSGSVYQDCLHNPGGGIESGETGEQAVIREVFEETGIKIDTALTFQATDDLVDLQWYPVASLDTLPLTPPAFELFNRIGRDWLIGAHNGN